MEITETDEVLIARGKYSTLTAKQKELEKAIQNLTQTIADHVRHALHAMDESSNYHLTMAQSGLKHLAADYDSVNEIRVQKDVLRPIAWATKEK